MGSCQCLEVTLLEICSPSLLSGALGGRGGLREAWNLGPAPRLDLLRPVSDYAVGLSHTSVITSCVVRGNNFCFWSLSSTPTPSIYLRERLEDP